MSHFTRYVQVWRMNSRPLITTTSEGRFRFASTSWSCNLCKASSLCESFLAAFWRSSTLRIVSMGKNTVDGVGFEGSFGWW